MISAQPRIQIHHKDGRITDARTGRRDRRAELEQFSHLLDSNNGMVRVPVLSFEAESALRELPREGSVEAYRLWDENERMKRIRSKGYLTRLVVPIIVIVAPLSNSITITNPRIFIGAITAITASIVLGTLWEIRRNTERFVGSLVQVGPRLNEFFTQQDMPDLIPPRMIDVTPK